MFECINKAKQINNNTEDKIFMVVAGDFRNGVTFDMDGSVYQIIEFQHVKPGKGAAFVRTKIRNVITGSVTERTFNPSDKFPEAFVERKEMQYLYTDGELYFFMDMESYEQIPLNKEILPENFNFVKENEMVKVMSYKGSVFGVEIPNFVELKVTFSEPAVKGDTVNNTMKPATLETGVTIKVPMFIAEGDLLKIDTRNGEYLERVKQA